MLYDRYEAQLEKDWKFIVEDSDAKVIVCANMRIYDIVKGYVNKVGKVQHVFVFDAPEGMAESYPTLLAKISDRKSLLPLHSLLSVCPLLSTHLSPYTSHYNTVYHFITITITNITITILIITVNIIITNPPLTII